MKKWEWDEGDGEKPELNVDFKKKIINQWDDLRPKERDFKDVYPAKEIEDDIKEYMKIKRNPDYRNKTVGAIVAEYALPQMIDTEQILGDKTFISISSEYDDHCRHVDFIVRYPANEEGKELYMGVDVKTIRGGQPNSKINDAIQAIVSNARFHKMTTVKYFIDPADQTMTHVEVPLIVIVFDSDEIVKYQEILAVLDKKRSSSQRNLLKIFQKEIIDKMKGNCEYMSEAVEKLMIQSKDPYLQRIVNAYRNFQKFLAKQEV